VKAVYPHFCEVAPEYPVWWPFGWYLAPVNPITKYGFYETRVDLVGYDGAADPDGTRPILVEYKCRMQLKDNKAPTKKDTLQLVLNMWMFYLCTGVRPEAGLLVEAVRQQPDTQNAARSECTIARCSRLSWHEMVASANVFLRPIHEFALAPYREDKGGTYRDDRIYVPNTLGLAKKVGINQALFNDEGECFLFASVLPCSRFQQRLVHACGKPESPKTNVICLPATCGQAESQVMFHPDLKDSHNNGASFANIMECIARGDEDDTGMVNVLVMKSNTGLPGNCLMYVRKGLTGADALSIEPLGADLPWLHSSGEALIVPIFHDCREVQLTSRVYGDDQAHRQWRTRLNDLVATLAIEIDNRLRTLEPVVANAYRTMSIETLWRLSTTRIYRHNITRHGPRIFEFDPEYWDAGVGRVNPDPPTEGDVVTRARTILRRCLHRAVNERLLRGTMALTHGTRHEYEALVDDPTKEWTARRLRDWFANEERTIKESTQWNRMLPMQRRWWSERAVGNRSNAKQFPHLSQRSMWTEAAFQAVLAMMVVTDPLPATSVLRMTANHVTEQLAHAVREHALRE
jgi:hypothetical protein